MDNVSRQVRGPADTITEVRTWALRAASAVALVAVVGAPAAASWHGLVRFGTRELGLTGGWELLVPISLDGAALYAALLAVRAVLAGDSAIWPRVLTCTYALAAAGFNAHAATSTAAALFYAGMSISAVVLWDTTLRALRRDLLRHLGVVQGATARYRPLRWLLAPGETGQAWRGAVLEDLTDPRAALAMVRGEVAPSRTDPPPPDGGTSRDGDTPLADLVCGEGHGKTATLLRPLHPAQILTAHDVKALPVGTKADAVRSAFDALGKRDVPAALAWLADRGITVDRSYAYTVSWEATPALRAVGGGDR